MNSMSGSDVEEDNAPLVRALDSGLDGKLVFGCIVEVKGGLGETGGLLRGI